MDSTQIRFVADEVLNHGFIINWRFDLLLLFAWILSISVSAFIGAYFSRKGENRANSEDLEAIKNQLRETTLVTEGIRTNLERMSGRHLKIEDLKREKLEAYLVAIEESAQYEND